MATEWIDKRSKGLVFNSHYQSCMYMNVRKISTLHSERDFSDQGAL